MDKLLEMSAKELSRLEVMQRLSRKQMSPKKAGRILGLSVRQIKRLLKAYRRKGAAGLVSKHLDLALQEKRVPPQPAPDHPWRRGFATPLSKHSSVIPASPGAISSLETGAILSLG